jgi:hypothetical protein
MAAMADLGDPKHWLPDESRLAVIRAAIAGYNADRPAIIRAHTRRFALMMGGFAIVAAAALAAGIASGNSVIAGLALGFAVFGGQYVWGKAAEPARRFRQDLRGRLFPAIFGFIPEFRYENARPPDFLERFKASGLIPWSSAGHDDWFSGAHDGLDFELSETRLFTGSGRHKQALFKGLILHIARQARFDGRLLAQTRTNAVHRYVRDLFSRELQTVSSGLTTVDDSHEFRTDTPGPEQAQLSIEIAKVLDWLQEFWRHGPVQIAVRETDCYLLLAGDADHFELPHIEAGDIDFDRDVLPLIKDMIALLAIAHLMAKIGAE